MTTQLKNWFELPNSDYIKQISDSLKINPEYWQTSDPSTNSYLLRHNHSIAYDNAWFESYNKGLTIARIQAYDLMYESADMTPAPGRLELKKEYAYSTAKDAALAFVTYDDASKYLSVTPEKLKMIIALTEHPAAILLYRTVVIFDKIKQDVANYENQCN
jgi:hypothetical protein